MLQWTKIEILAFYESIKVKVKEGIKEPKIRNFNKFFFTLMVQPAGGIGIMHNDLTLFTISGTRIWLQPAMTSGS